MEAGSPPEISLYLSNCLEWCHKRQHSSELYCYYYYYYYYYKWLFSQALKRYSNKRNPERVCSLQKRICVCPVCRLVSLRFKINFLVLFRRAVTCEKIAVIRKVLDGVSDSTGRKNLPWRRKLVSYSFDGHSHSSWSIPWLRLYD